MTPSPQDPGTPTEHRELVQSAQEPGTPTDRRELLQFVVKTHRDEMAQHEDERGKTFNWTLTILLALTAGMFSFAGSAGWGSKPDHWPLKLIVSFTSGLITFLAAIEIIRRATAQEDNAKIVAKASNLLHLFDPNYFSNPGRALYSEQWKEWGGKRTSLKDYPYFHVFVLVVVAFGSIVLTWLL